MGKIKDFKLNRKQYDRIKRMDHCQMSAWTESIYKSGYEDGMKAAEGLAANEVKEVISSIKGIGEKRVETIITALNNAQERKSKQYE